MRHKTEYNKPHFFVSRNAATFFASSTNRFGTRNDRTGTHSANSRDAYASIAAPNPCRRGRSVRARDPGVGSDCATDALKAKEQLLPRLLNPNHIPRIDIVLQGNSPRVFLPSSRTIR